MNADFWETLWKAVERSKNFDLNQELSKWGGFSGKLSISVWNSELVTFCHILLPKQFQVEKYGFANLLRPAKVD